MTIASRLHECARSARASVNPQRPEDQQQLLHHAQRLLDIDGVSHDALHRVACDREAPLEHRIAAKLAQSRQALLAVEHPLTVAVVFAMWGEHNRLRPMSVDNPHGEDALRLKMDQLAWATAQTQVSWRLFAVDDGCPDGFAAVAREQLEGHPHATRVSVLELADALPTDREPLAALASADASQKGGALIYGALTAIDAGADAVVTTDADRELLRVVLQRPGAYDFSFDTDWIAAALARDEPFVTAPFAFIDSVAESTAVSQGAERTWFVLLRGITDQVKARGLDHDVDMARLVEEELQTREDVAALLQRLPPELEGAADRAYGDPQVMSVARALEWVRQCKSAEK